MQAEEGGGGGFELYRVEQVRRLVVPAVLHFVSFFGSGLGKLAY